MRDLRLPPWVVWSAIVAVYVVVRWNLVDVPLGRNEGIFGYIGQVILDGGIPYRDAFDHKPPGVFYINALALLLVPPSPRGIHVFLHAYNFVTLVALYLTTRAWSGSRAAAGWAALAYAVLSAGPATQGFQASTEMFMLLPLVVALWLVVMGAHRERVWPFLASGVLGALACWIKPPAATSVLFVVLYLAVGSRGSGEDGSARWRRVGWWFAGAAGVSALICIYFWVHGVFREFLYWSFEHNLHYSGGGLRLGNVGRVLLSMFRGNFAIILAALVAASAQAWREKPRGGFLWGFLALSLAGTIPGKAYEHYFCQLLPPLALAAGVGFAWAIGAVEGRPARWAAAALAVGLVVAVPLGVHAGYFVTRSPVEIAREQFGMNPFPESIDIAAWIAAETGPDDTVLIVGSEAQILFMAERRSVTPHVFFYPLLRSFPRHREFQEETWRRVRRAPPRVIVWVNLRTSLLWDGKAETRILENTQELISREYELRAVTLIAKPKGRLVEAAEIGGMRETIEKYPFRVLIYKRRR